MGLLSSYTAARRCIICGAANRACTTHVGADVLEGGQKMPATRMYRVGEDDFRLLSEDDATRYFPGAVLVGADGQPLDATAAEGKQQAGPAEDKSRTAPQADKSAGAGAPAKPAGGG